jgi:hypothetical protein
MELTAEAYKQFKAVFESDTGPLVDLDNYFKDFQTAFDGNFDGIDDVEEYIKDLERRISTLDAVCERACQKLVETEYGRALNDDPCLTKVIDDLEAGLGKVLDEMVSTSEIGATHPLCLWVDGSEWARRYKFMGRVGAIFSYFRDDPRIFSTAHERGQRAALRRAADSFTDQVHSLLGHITVELTYKKSTVGLIRKISKDLETLRSALDHPPIEYDLDENSFHGGKTIIVRQFSHAVCQLGFEVFGWITPKVLDAMLLMKSTSADRFGLTPWIRTEGKSAESRKRDLRRYVERSLDIACIASKRHEWSASGIIEFFSENRERFIHDDGLEDPGLRSDR